MARQYKLRWKIPFQTFMGEQLEVQIEQDGWTGGVTTISDAGTNGKMFAAQRPFETKGQTDTDIFKPIRTQSGYIRVVCKDESWRNLIPTNNGQNRVKLIRKSNNQVLWLGFMKAEMYKHTLYEFADTYEFPIICPLCLLKQQDFDFTNKETVTFHSLISEIFDTIQNSYGFQFQFHDIFEDRIYLDARISRMQWIALNDEYHINRNKQPWKSGAKLYDILEEICRFWGFTCEMNGDIVTFSATDMETIGAQYPYSTMREFPDADPNEGSETVLTLQPLPIDEQIMDNKTQEEFTQPASQVVIETNFDKVELNMEVPDMKELRRSGYPLRTYRSTRINDEGEIVTVVSRELDTDMEPMAGNYERYTYNFPAVIFRFFSHLAPDDPGYDRDGDDGPDYDYDY